ncbi:DUF2029 domain-containing protein [Anabaena cylindrica FACHB-243]|uniref:DUF2029 domain-containing protein n=1 Tax=Anabaena cylindrica (strain ATCC 27899 / PCC 7122) TaxID=272123 RepID=K9ZIJ3_ANACC|nr:MULTISPECIES: glycosyltransferase family 87 protein [Anabaena]AFZ59053.1 hypothetical protein Anacy_3664 [Anabaena cylindrica PCC 7122]MBD2420608.1 DUF2029 domain-containing protein [Anabaena cylindrica FACHB-243]MBY5282359.1 DUF2029 domain-containing protein [Anabaena sp. CCAP 1446/1C]MBY5309230.1 DUF2029 domain-containing protein [Anabaena sp. CCAP 1446/1C]MCM2408566.1 DUF2029 domain-containing protein [Anabaena sp. CCAP 1446/1C]
MNNQAIAVFLKKFNPPKIIFSLSLVLSLLCFAYLFRGFYYLIIDEIGAGDLHSRWQEQQYIYRGLYPYDITKGSLLIDPQLGAVTSGGYPPWAFFTGFIFFPPISWELTRWYHALLNTISLVILAIFAYQIGKPYGKLKSWFTVVACLSISSHSTTLGLGQYGIIINALLIGVFWLLKKNHNLSAGLFLGLALVKPSISALYFFIVIIRKNFDAVLACCLYLVIASYSIGIVTQTSPIYMIEKMVKVSQYYVSTGYSAINIFTNFGINPLVATIFLAVLATAIILGIFYLFKDNSLLFFFAIASVMGRLCTYHLIYDNVMLVFVLLAIISLAFHKPNKSNILILILVLLSLLLPGKSMDLPFAKILQSIIWIAAFFYLLINQKQFHNYSNNVN